MTAHRCTRSSRVSGASSGPGSAGISGRACTVGTGRCQPFGAAAAATVAADLPLSEEAPAQGRLHGGLPVVNAYPTSKDDRLAWQLQSTLFADTAEQLSENNAQTGNWLSRRRIESACSVVEARSQGRRVCKGWKREGTCADRRRLQAVLRSGALAAAAALQRNRHPRHHACTSVTSGS